MISGFFSSIAMYLFGLLVLVALFRRSEAASTGSPLALRAFQVNAESSPAVLIEGRTPGLIAWLLTMVGIDAYTVFIVTKEQIRIRRAGLSGEHHTVIPTASVASTQCGYTQPLMLLILAALFLFVTLVFSIKLESAAVMLVGLLSALACALFYVYRRTIQIVLETSGGRQVGVAFRPSFVEGVHVNLQMALQATARLNNIIVSRSTLSTTEENEPPAAMR